MSDFDIRIQSTIGDTMVCPGCGEKLTLDWADGWTTTLGLGCVGYTTHTDHIYTLGPIRDASS